MKASLWAVLAGMAMFNIAGTACAQSGNDEFGRTYQPFLEVRGHMGQGPELGRPTVFLPIVQSPYEMIFADVTAVFSDEDTFELNAGLGYRAIQTDGWLFGTYAYLDWLRTANENRFHQVTLGVEFMNVEWDFRANVYIPQKSGEAVSPREAIFDGNTIRVRRNEELAYFGTDFEVGYLLADWREGDAELRGYLGGFYFDRNISLFEAIVGPRARLEMRLFDLPWLGNGSRVMIGGQYRYDDVRGSVGEGLVSVRMPFGPGGRPKLGRLQRRMLNPVVRDVNVVAQAGTRTEYGIDPDTGQRFGTVSVADATTANLQGDITTAGMNSTLILEGDEGSFSVNTPLVLDTGQTVRGAGFAVIGEESRKTVIFGSKAAVNGTDPAQDVFVLADQSTLKDVTISGGRNGIFGASVADVTVLRNTIGSTTQAGVALTGSSSGTVDENIVTSVGTDGISLADFTGTVSSNRVTLSGQSGIVMTSFAGTAVNDNILSENTIDGLRIDALSSGTVSENTATENGDDGFEFGSIADATVEKNTATQNTDNGFEIGTMGLLTGDNPTLTENLSRQNAGHGFSITDHSRGTTSMNTASLNQQHGFQFGTLNSGSITENTAFQNVGSGFDFTLQNSGFVNQNTANQNGLHGIAIATMSNGLVTDNILTNNTFNGIQVDDMFGQVNRNTATGNLNGISIDLFDGGFINQNTVSQNLLDGVVIPNFNWGNLTTNTADQNGDDGFDIGAVAWTRGDIDDNTATNNPQFGFRIQNRVAIDTSASGNVATGNGDNTLPLP